MMKGNKDTMGDNGNIYVILAYTYFAVDVSRLISGFLSGKLHNKTLGRMRTPVREAFSYGIRHVIRHAHCDSMSYNQIRVKPYPVSYRVYHGVAKYGV